MQYDSSFINKYARRLYARANSVIATSTFLIGVFGLLGGGTVGGVISDGANPPYISAGIGALLFGFLGYRIGSERAFRIKLEAQVALCQVQIEENTRATASVVRSKATSGEVTDETNSPPIIS